MAKEAAEKKATKAEEPKENIFQRLVNLGKRNWKWLVGILVSIFGGGALGFLIGKSKYEGSSIGDQLIDASFNDADDAPTEE